MPEAYGAALLVRGKDMAYIERVMLPANPQTVSLFIVAILVGGLLGAYLGQVLLKKQQAENGTGILTSCFGLDNIKDNK